jgi:hypothetical protein
LTAVYAFGYRNEQIALSASASPPSGANVFLRQLADVLFSAAFFSMDVLLPLLFGFGR